MRVEHHLLGLPRIGGEEHLAAECQAEVRDLDGLHDAVDLDMLVAPVELTDLTGREGQWHKGLRRWCAGFGRLSTLNEPLYAVVGTTNSDVLP